MRAEPYPALVDLIRSELLGNEKLIVRIGKAVALYVPPGYAVRRVGYPRRGGRHDT